MFKKLLLMGLCMCTVVGFSACGQKEETTSVSGPMIPSQDPMDLDGEYKETSGSGATMSIEYDELGEKYGVMITLPGETEEDSILWVMTTTKNVDGSMPYEDGLKIQGEDGEPQTGLFTYTDDGIKWDGAADDECKEWVFVNE